MKLGYDIEIAVIIQITSHNLSLLVTRRINDLEGRPLGNTGQLND